jgi:hypothetical protein
MMSAARTPRPGAANGVVPKNDAEHDRRRHQPAGNSGRAEQRLRHRGENKERHEQADAAIGDGGAGEHDRDHRAAFAELLGHEARDGGNRARVFHQLAEHRAEQKQRKELRQESRGAAHEGLRPVGEQRLAAKGGGEERRGRRQHQYAPAAESEPNQKQQADKNAEKSHLNTRSAARRDRRWSACRDARRWF